MNENYLWDKTGEDAEIEKLEDLMKGFRQSKISAPKLPQIEAPKLVKKSRKIFRYLIAIAACVAFAIISIGFWVNSSINKNDEVANKIVPNENLSKPETPQQVDSDFDYKVADVPIRKEKNSRPIPAKLVSLKRNEQKNEMVKVRLKIDQNPREVKLTADEKFAYEQLKLALSITGTQLKIVKDKVEGDEGDSEKEKIGSK
jgi:hypothetical protein